MTWNCRIVRYLDGTMELCEVFYNENNEPKYFGVVDFKYTADEGHEALIKDLEYALKDIQNSPILNVSEFN